MASKKQSVREKSVEQVASEVGLYPCEAYEFVQQGLGFTVARIHGQDPKPKVDRHISGQQLCEGLRDYALTQWGRLSRTVLGRWNITSTLDFGRIVFALIEAGQMHKTDEDTIDDFRAVFEFRKDFESGYRIEVAALAN